MEKSSVWSYVLVVISIIGILTPVDSVPSSPLLSCAAFVNSGYSSTQKSKYSPAAFLGSKQHFLSDCQSQQQRQTLTQLESSRRRDEDPYDNDDEDDDRELVYARRRRGRRGFAAEDDEYEYEVANEDNYFDDDDEEDVMGNFDADEFLRNEKKYADIDEEYDGIVPNYLLDVVDPEGAVDRIVEDEVWKDPEFIRDVVIVVLIVVFFGAVPDFRAMFSPVLGETWY